MRTDAYSNGWMIKTALVTALAVTGVLPAGADTLPIQLRNGVPAVAVGTYNGTEDTYLREAYPNAAPGKYPSIAVGYESSGNGGRNRALIRFNISGLKPLIISGTTTIKSARIKLSLIGIAGTAMTAPKTVYIYRVTTADRSWSPGTVTTNVDSSTEATCWQYKIWNNNIVPPVTGTVQHQPWAGTQGAGTAGTDYVATPLASASVPAAAVAGTEVSFEFTDPAFLLEWINDNNANTGFLIGCPDLEGGAKTSCASIAFGSCDNLSEASRPLLQLVLENYNPANAGAIAYTLPASGKVSINIFNSNGDVVKQLIAGQQRNSGQNFEPWNCKRDAVHLSDTLSMTVPDGQYTVRLLQTHGLRSEYLLNLGFKDPSWKQWPGSHVTPNGIALDATGFVVGSAGSEGAPGMIKVNYDGSYRWRTGGSGWPGDFWSGSAALRISGDTIFAIKIDGKIDRFKYTSSSATPISPAWTTGFSASNCFGYDLAMRKGRIIAVSPVEGFICWLTLPAGTAGPLIPVPGAMGVAMDTAGNALVAAGDSILKFTYGNNTPVVLIGSGLKMPTRLDVNPANGDMYVVEGDTGATRWSLDPRHMPNDGARWQIKRFSSTGTLLGTFGAAGGRDMRRGGRWSVQKYNFTWVNNIAAHADGSFYITEAHAPRRVAHFSSSGAFIEEWLAPPQCDVHASANPSDPTDVWYHTYLGYLLRAKVNYQTRTYELAGYYNTGTNPAFEKSWGADGPVWNVSSRGGKTYIYHSVSPTLMVYDSLGDSLRPIAVGWYKNSGDTASWKSSYATGSYSWTDANGDGQMQASENIHYPSTANSGLGNVASAFPDMQITYTCSMDTNFNYVGQFALGHTDLWDSVAFSIRLPQGGRVCPFGFGPGSLRPAGITTVAGNAAPVWKWGDLDWPTQGFPAAIDYDSLGQWAHGPAYAQYATGVWPYAIRNVWDRGSIADDSGNIFQVINYEQEHSWQRVEPEWYGSANVKNGGNYIIKYDRNGVRQWMAGKHAAGATPNPGEIITLCGILGTAHGCVIARDYFPYQYVYNKDGLYVGRLLENPVDSQAAQTSTVGTLFQESFSAGWGEQFAGSAFEVKNNATPGLQKGDVLFFGFGVNDNRIMKITGWENWTEISTVLTVVNGQITGQTTPVVNAPALMHGQHGQTNSLTLRMASGRPGIAYTVQKRAPVRLDIYNTRGQRVATLVNQIKAAGSYSASLTNANTGGRFPRGYYLILLTVGSERISKPLVLVR